MFESSTPIVESLKITHHDSEAIRQSGEAGEISKIQSVVPTDITLLAAVELACCCLLSDRLHPSFVAIIDVWARRLPLLKSAIEALVSRRLPSRKRAFGAETSGFFPVTHRDWNDNDHHLFEGRFTAAVKNSGFSRKTSLALAGAFKEMADNIVQHSAPFGKPPAAGVLGYLVSGKTMSFVVADVGRGVLASLHENPQWACLSDSSEALEAITKKQASRRVGMGSGGGFLQLFKSLADMHGHLIFRSGDGVLEIRREPDGRRGTKGFSHPLPGLQLSVSCSCG